MSTHNTCHMFSWRNKKNINLILPHPSYLEMRLAYLKLGFSVFFFLFLFFFCLVVFLFCFVLFCFFQQNMGSH